MQFNGKACTGSLFSWIKNLPFHIGKTKKIGANLFSTSATQSCIQEAYRKIGQAVFEEVKSGRWQVPQCNRGTIKECVELISRLEENMEKLQGELRQIKEQKK